MVQHLLKPWEALTKLLNIKAVFILEAARLIFVHSLARRLIIVFQEQMNLFVAMK